MCPELIIDFDRRDQAKKRKDVVIMIHRKTIHISILLAILIFCSAPSNGEEEAPAVEPRADKILRQMSEYLNSLVRAGFPFYL